MRVPASQVLPTPYVWNVTFQLESLILQDFWIDSTLSLFLSSFSEQT